VHDSGRSARLSPWGRLVVVSAVVVVGCLVGLGGWAIASSQERVVTFAVRGQLEGVALDVDDADVTVVRGAGRRSVGFERTDRFTFNHDAKTERSVRGGVFRLRSRCPGTVLGSCSASYRVTVPDNVPVEVRTDEGRVRLEGYRGSARVTTDSGDISAGAFCGFLLEARAESGDVSADAACAPQQLSLRSGTGAVHAVVPPGRYEVDADTAAGRRTVRGVGIAIGSPFHIQALSSAGDVTVEAGP
jgi:Putative adhesin